MKTQSTQAGFSHTFVVLSLLLLALIGFAGYNVLNKNHKNTATNNSSAATVQLPAKISNKAQAQQAAKALDKESIDTSLDSGQLDADLNSVL